MININDISRAMAFLEISIQKSDNAEDKKYLATTMEVLRLFLAYPLASLELYKKNIEGRKAK